MQQKDLQSIIKGMALQQKQYFRSTPQDAARESPSDSRRSTTSHRFMRVGKVNFPKFGGEYLQGWLYRCSHFFAIDETPGLEKLRYDVVHLEGGSLQ